MTLPSFVEPLPHFEAAWPGVMAALGSIAHDHEDMRDIMAVDTAPKFDQNGHLGELRLLASRGQHICLVQNLTLTNLRTGNTLCITVGLSSSPPTSDQSGLLAWQFDIWLDQIPRSGVVSRVLALSADSAELVIIEQLTIELSPFISQFIEECQLDTSAFVSYVREDEAEVAQLCLDLNGRGVATWRDRSDLPPGVRWKDVIRTAIKEGGAFIACFSANYLARPKTYMNEELVIGIEELRQRPRDRAWFFPVSVDGSQVPALPIGAGETLRDLQSVSLASGRDEAVKGLAKAVREAGRRHATAITKQPSEGTAPSQGPRH